MTESTEDPNEQLKRSIKCQKIIIGFLYTLLISFLIVNIAIYFEYQSVPSILHISQEFVVDVKYEQPKTKPAISKELERYIVNTKGCRIPDLNPFDQWLHNPKAKALVCEPGNLPLILANNSAIFVNPDARDYYYPRPFQVNCCWRTFYRSQIRDNRILYTKICKKFDEVAAIKFEFIKVECQLPNNTIYNDYFAFVQPNVKVEKRCRENKILSGSPKKQLNVLVVGMNSVSRLNLHRSMPRTVEILGQMGAVEMLGYNKVGYNMYQNLVPVLSGLPHADFDKLCWKHSKTPFDMCPLIWKRYVLKGYRSVLAEDNCNTTLFNYLRPGFRMRPTDYYLRPLCVAAEPSIGNREVCNTYMCQGTRYTFSKLLDYTRRVATEFKDKPYFAFSWETSLTHDFMKDAQLGDGHYYDFLKYLGENDLLHNTALVFMSDHGMRWGKFRWTYQGRLEENLPFAFVKMPEWWKQQYPEAWKNLKKNSKRLTTPFDVYETFRDILEPERLQDDVENSLYPPMSYGTSMFKPISKDRTCESAGIPDHWCSCHHRHNISKENATLDNLGNFIVDKINKKLVTQTQCAKLQLASIVDAKSVNDVKFNRELKLEEGDEYLSNEDKWNWNDYSLTIMTKPGNGIFEGTVRFNGSDSMELIGSISRMNDYANRSSCVNSFDLRFYCSCEAQGS